MGMRIHAHDPMPDDGSELAVAACPTCGSLLRPAHVEPTPAGDACAFCGMLLDGRDPRALDEPEPDPIPIETGRGADTVDLGRLAATTESLLDRPRRGRALQVALVVASLVGVVAIGATGRGGPVPASSVTPPRPAAPAPPSPAPATSPAPTRAPAVDAIVARLRFDERCWVEATRDGRPVVARTFEAGETLRLRAARVVALRLGNAGGVLLTVNGEEVPTGPSGAVVDLSLELRDDRVVVRRGEA
jgi:hypothetical protein